MTERSATYRGATRARKTPGFMRTVLAHNVRRFMDMHFVTHTNKPKALATACGMSLSSIQRVLAGTVGVSIDNLEAIAAVFHLSSYQLLIPSVDVNNPQAVIGATKEEEQLYRLWKRAPTAINPPRR